MASPTINDLTVYRHDADSFDVYSHLTRGRCATVYKFSFSNHYNIVPFLIPSYMQGITYTLIEQAVKKFIEDETKQ